MKKFIGENIYLRLIEESDIDERYISWYQDNENLKYYSGTKRDYSFESLLDEINKGKISKKLFIYGIFTNLENKCIGNIKIGPIIVEHKISDMIVMIGDADYHGKGYATEAIKVGNKIAFEVYNIRKLYGGMYENNISSIKCYTRAGWYIEGNLKGYYLVDGKSMDRVLVSCLNPKYFD